MTTEGAEEIPASSKNQKPTIDSNSYTATGRRRNTVLLAVIVWVTVTVIWASLFTTDRFVDRDAFDYAQIGRQIAHRKGFTTRQLFPRHIPYVDHLGFLHDDAWPSLLRYPIPPVMNAAAQVVAGDPALSAAIQSGLWFVVSVPVFFLFINRLSDLMSSILGTVILVGDPRIWRDAYNGMTESLAILLYLCFFSVAVRQSTLAGRQRNWLLLGLICGFAILVRTQSVVLIVLGFILSLWIPRIRERAVCVVSFVGAAATTMSPWLARNFAVTGDPFFAFTNTRNLLAKTAHHHRIDLRLDAPVDLGTVLGSYGSEIATKFWSQVWPNLVDPSFWFEAIGWYAAIYFLTVAYLTISRSDIKSTRSYVIFERAVPMLIGLNFLVVSMIYHRQRYYDPLLPLIIIVLAIRVPKILESIASRIRMRPDTSRNIIFLGLMIVAGARAGATFVDHARNPGIPDVDLDSFHTICALADRDDLVVSDFSAQITLFCESNTVRLPSDLEDLLKIDDRYLQIDLVVISRRAAKAAKDPVLTSDQFQGRFERLPDLANGAAVYRRKISD